MRNGPFATNRQAAAFAAVVFPLSLALWLRNVFPAFQLALLAAPVVLSALARSRSRVARATVGWWWWLVGARPDRKGVVIWHPHKLTGAVAVVIAVTYCVAATTQPGTVVVVWVLLVGAAAVRSGGFGFGQGKRPESPLADPERHLRALRAAGFARATQDDDGTPVYVRPVRSVGDDGSESVHYALPEGVSVGKLITARSAFVSELRLPGIDEDRIVLSRYRGLGYHLTVTVKAPPADVSAARHPVISPAARWSDPVVLGRDKRTGGDVVAPTYDVGLWLAGGMTGSGKTVALRLLLARYAADPTAVLYGVDGKGSSEDWGPLRGRFTEWVDIHDDGAAQLLLDMLGRVAELVRARNRAGGRTHPGCLVLLEEVTSLRARLTPADQRALDRRLIEIVQTCRSANVLIVISAQRPSAELMSTSIRAQAGVALCLRVKRQDDAAMILGFLPTDYDVEAFATGHGLVDTGAGPTPLVLDYSTDDAWRVFCAALPAATVEAPQDAPAPPVATPSPPAAAPVPTPTPAAEPPPLFWAALAVVRAHPDGELAPTPLFNALPDAVRPMSVKAMSVELGEAGWRSQLVRRQGVKTRMFVAADLAGAAGTGPAVGASVP